MLKSLRQNIGICLVFLGVALSMFLNFFFPVIYWTPIVMFLSCVLMCDKGTLTSKLAWNKTFKILVIFQVIMLFYFAVSFNEELANNIKYKLLSFHLYILTLAFILMKTRSLRERDFLPYLFVISGILAMLSAFCYYGNIIEAEKMLKREDAILEAFTLNIPAFINFSSSLLLLSRKKNKFILLFLVFAFIDFYVIMMSGKRSYFVSLIGVAGLYLYKLKLLKKGIFYSGLIFVILNIMLPQARELTETLIDRTIVGFSTVFIDEKSTYVDWDNSESIRAWSQQVAMEKFSDFNIFNYIFGGGYYLWFFDNPLGEAFLDMGLIGLFFFTYLIVYVPISTYRKCSKADHRLLLCIFIASFNIWVILTNYDPYNYLEYTPICMLAMCTPLNKSYRKIERPDNSLYLNKQQV